MKIKLLCCDVDGTLTDGGIYLDANGIEQKRFCCRDGAGFHNLKIGFPSFKIAFITSENGGVNKIRYRKFSLSETVDFYIDKVHGFGKALAVNELSEKNKIDLKHIAYVGDDINDLQAMVQVAENEGYLFCPKNADQEIKNLVLAYKKETGKGFPLYYPGGYGAVRECCDIIIALNEGKP